MDAWWRRVKIRKAARGHQTPGREKVETCQASTLDRYFARCSRSYKDKRYNAWLDKVRKQCHS